MKLVVLGLSLSSAWGNGHATTYRALLKAFAARGHNVLFLERDVPWYAAHRDLPSPDFCRLALYPDIDALERWAGEVERADAVIVGSYVPDGIAIGSWVHRLARGVTAFYDIDTPVTLAALKRGEESYISAAQIAEYDLYLSFTGGPILDRLVREFGSPAAYALYCSVDIQAYVPRKMPWRWDLTYLGTYSADRQSSLDRLLLEVARRAPQRRFAVAGAQYPSEIDWPGNVEHVEHVSPADHPVFYGASRFTLNVTRGAMSAAGHSPSVRLFEAGACATAIISDRWAGLDTLFRPDQIVIADTTDCVLQLLEAPEQLRETLAEGARRQVLASHTAVHRAAELENLLMERAVPLDMTSQLDIVRMGA